MLMAFRYYIAHYNSVNRLDASATHRTLHVFSRILKT